MNRFQQSFFGEIPANPPFWFMRQAGRYLPEYRKLREQAGGFLDLCYTPEQAAEVTLQPIRRFGMDAAIIFSDILVIPHAMGCDVGFVQGEGPKLTPLTHTQEIEGLTLEIENFLSPVYEALRITRRALPKETTLIGFAGSPWTLACYMLEGQGGGEFEKARHVLYSNSAMMGLLIEKLTDAVSTHLLAQIEAGADAVQIFDSWAGLIPAGRQDAMLFAPARKIVHCVKKKFPHIPVIGFPRGQVASLTRYVEETGVDGVSVDSFTPLAEVIKTFPKNKVLQGNLDPILLATHKETTLSEAENILQTMSGRRFIFNLGHGILQQTPVAHMEALVHYLAKPQHKACA